MKGMATSPDYRHVPTSVLALLAQRAGKVFASPATWCRYGARSGLASSSSALAPEQVHRRGPVRQAGPALARRHHRAAPRRWPARLSASAHRQFQHEGPGLVGGRQLRRGCERNPACEGRRSEEPPRRRREASVRDGRRGHRELQRRDGEAGRRTTPCSRMPPWAAARPTKSTSARPPRFRTS